MNQQTQKCKRLKVRGRNKDNGYSLQLYDSSRTRLAAIESIHILLFKRKGETMTHALKHITNFPLVKPSRYIMKHKPLNGYKLP
jgi:hypothetical protein